VSESSPADPGRWRPPLAAALALVSLWCFASAATPRWLELVSLPLALGAVTLGLWARRSATGVGSALALALALVVLAGELALSALARM
jgi:hypothetical protein